MERRKKRNCKPNKVVNSNQKSTNGNSSSDGNGQPSKGAIPKHKMSDSLYDLKTLLKGREKELEQLKKDILADDNKDIPPVTLFSSNNRNQGKAKRSQDNPVKVDALQFDNDDDSIASAHEKMDLLRTLLIKRGKIDPNKVGELREELKNGGKAKNSEVDSPDASINQIDEARNVDASLDQLNLIPAGAALVNPIPVDAAMRCKNTYSFSQCPMIDARSYGTGAKYKCNISEDRVIPINSVNNSDKRQFKIGCCCKKCKHFNISTFDDMLDYQPNNIKPETSIPSVMKHFIKDFTVKYQYVNMHSKKFDSSMKSKAVARQVLAHGTTPPVMAELFHEIPFEKSVHSALRQFHFKELKPVQTFALPAIMKHSHVCMVSGSKSGKTMAYISALLSFKMDGEMYGKLPYKDGPFSIVLCSNSLNVEKIHDMFKNFSKSRELKSVFTCAMAFNLVDSKMPKINKNADVLVVNPSSLIVLLKNNVITLKRLCHIIIEDIDIIARDYLKALTSIFQLINEMLCHRRGNQLVQFICTSENWTKDLETTLKKLYKVPLICIANPIQAAAYGNANIQLIEVPANDKSDKVVELILELSQMPKSLIVCDIGDIDEIRIKFKTKKIDVLCIDETMCSDDICDIENMWCRRIYNTNTVLVCTDQILVANLCIRDAWLLINYSIPKTWSIFTRRFAYLIDHYISPFQFKDSCYKSKIITLIDENAFKSFPRINHFFESMGTTLPSRLIEAAEIYNMKEEESKMIANVNLCNVLKTFGKCNVLKCSGRHILNKELDKPNRPFFPSRGKLKYKILEILNINRFLVKPLEYIDCEDITHDLEAPIENILFSLKINKCYNVSTTIRIQGTYVFLDDSNCTRCVVNKIVSMDSITREPLLVEIQSLDFGFVKVVNTKHLMIMPNALKDIPPSYMELCIVNLIPSNNEPDWNNVSIMHMALKLNAEQYKNKNSYCLDNIELQIGNTVWVDDLHLNVYLAKVSKEVTIFRLRNFVEYKRLAVINEESLIELYSLCKKHNIELPNYKRFEKDTFKGSQVTPQWAHLTDREFNTVYFCSGITPNKFYVRQSKFIKLYMQMQIEIQKEIKSAPYLSLSAKEITVGHCYLGMDPNDSEYYRVIVQEIVGDKADCVFVDDGSLVYIPLTELKHLSNYFITVLPFQAIECSLYGIKPREDNWMNEVDNLYNYCHEPDSDYYRILFSYTKRIAVGKFSGSRRYEILLIDYIDNYKVINEIFRDENYGICSEGVTFNIDKKALDNKRIASVNDAEREFKERSIEQNPDEMVDDEWDFEIFNFEQFFRALTGQTYVDKVTPKASSSKNMQTVEVHTNNPLSTTSEQCLPDILWYQTKNYIRFDICLTDVIHYSITLAAGRLLRFKCLLNHKEYKLCFQLFDTVRKEFQHKAKSRCIKVTLIKIQEFEWPRLVFMKDGMRNIKYNCDKIYIEEDDEAKKRFLDIGKTEEDGNDEDEDEEDDEQDDNVNVDEKVYDSFSASESSDYGEESNSD